MNLTLLSWEYSLIMYQDVIGPAFPGKVEGCLLQLHHVLVSTVGPVLWTQLSCIGPKTERNNGDVTIHCCTDSTLLFLSTLKERRKIGRGINLFGWLILYIVGTTYAYKQLKIQLTADSLESLVTVSRLAGFSQTV